MSSLKEVLAMIHTVEFKEIKPTDATKLGGFIERAAVEVKERADLVMERERVVSERESAVQHREDEVESKLTALQTIDRMQRTINKAGGEKNRRWFTR